MLLILFTSMFLIVIVCAICYFFWRWYKNKYIQKISPDQIHRLADLYGVSNKKLDPQTMPGSHEQMYEELQRVRGEQAFEIALTAQFYAIVASVAAIHRLNFLFRISHGKVIERKDVLLFSYYLLYFNDVDSAAGT